MHNWLNASVMMTAAAALSGCLMMEKSSDRLALHLSISGSGFGAIRTLGSAQQANCVGCHSDGGRSPRWMANDESRAAGAISYALDTGSPADSYLVSKATDGHFLPTGKLLDKGMWIDAVTAYLTSAGDDTGGGSLPDDDDGSAGSRGRLFTLPLQVPAPIPTYNPAAPQNPANFKVLTYPLNLIGLPGVSITIEIVMDNVVPNTYRLYQPKIVNTTAQSIYIEGVKVIYNGGYAAGAQSNWNSVLKFVPPGTVALPSNPIISPAAILLSTAIPGGSLGDNIQISFEKAEITTAVSCQALAQFVTTVKPIIQTAINCFRCHQAANNNALLAFNMNGTDDTLCANFLGRSDLTTASQSAILVYPGSARNGHPTINPTYNTVQITTITSWIDAEATARGL